MFTPKLEVVRELKIPLVTTTFSPTIVKNPECGNAPQSATSHLSDEDLYEQVEKLINYNGLIKFEQMPLLRLYGVLWLDDASDSCITFKTRKDIWIDSYIEALVDHIHDGYYPDWFNNVLSQIEIDRGSDLSNSKSLDSNLTQWEQCRRFVNDNADALSKYLEEDMDYNMILNEIGKNIHDWTKDLYLIKEY